MYRIHNVTAEMLKWHLDSLVGKTSQLMEGFRDGALTFDGSVGRTKDIKFIYKVCKGSPTWNFLQYYSSYANLKTLLSASWEDCLAILHNVEAWNTGKEWKTGINKKKFLAGDFYSIEKNDEGLTYVDDFHDILYHIFVEMLYEKNLDKLQFIKKMNLKVCPYCGRNQINVASYEGKRDSKPPIDHFLPKSKYPFLAVSFYNLIPCCTTCNDISNKGAFDPLENELSLENPHVFVDEHVRFKGEFPEMLSMNEDDYDVNMQFAPKRLSIGYKDTLKLEVFYKDEKQKMIDMHENLLTFSDGRKENLASLGIEDSYLNDIQKQVLGYRLDGKTFVREFYKFKKEMFEQLLEKYKLR